MDKRIDLLLKKSGLSVTDSRKKILEIFYESQVAMAHADIELAIKEKFDRVTVYRTLQVFLDKGILHVVPGFDNAIKYALCKDECTEGNHYDNHIHFLCKKCGNTSCLSDTVIPKVNLPKGFNAVEFQMIVNGYCRDCQ